MRTCVYVDGFNLYYGALKGTPYRWLNLVELARQFLPANHQVEKVKYFTARVSGATDPNEPKKQQAYLSALETLPEIEIHYGRFLAKTIWRPLINLPVANAVIHSSQQVSLDAGTHQVSGTATGHLPVGSYPQRGAHRRKGRKTPQSPVTGALITEVHTMEEKGSDVNLAAHLLYDACRGIYQAAVVISNDTDLITPIDMVANHIRVPTFVVCPGRWQMAPGLRTVATYVRHIRPAMLAASQLPDPILPANIQKPANW